MTRYDWHPDNLRQCERRKIDIRTNALLVGAMLAGIVVIAVAAEQVLHVVGW